MSELSDLENEEPLSDQVPGSPEKRLRRRSRKRKVRTRVRIKKKSGPFRKFRKIAEKVIWLVVIIGFITTLVVLMKQLDLSDPDAKKRKKKKKSFIPQHETTLTARLGERGRAWFLSDPPSCNC